MGESLQKAFFGVLALGVSCIAIELIPVSRQAAYWNRCLDASVKLLETIPELTEWDKEGKIIKGTDKDLGGTMRLGLYEAKLRNNSAIKRIYKSNSIKERHRHRYEVNNNLKNEFEKKGLIFSGMSPDNKLPEIIELKNHPWFIGVQFHPEFKSRPLTPHPLFSSFIKAAKINSKK